MTTIDQILFGYYPYVCLTVFVLGLAYRFEREQYTWQAASSQMLRTKRGFNLASNLFHLGILGLLGGHVAGLLVPAQVYHFLGVTDSMHQMVELVMGSMTGAATLIGLSMLLIRRVTDPRIRSTSNFADLAIALLLWLTLVVGLATLPFSYETRHTGEYLHALSGWAQGIVTLSSNSVLFLAGVPWTFKFHILCGLTVFLVFPFTRLVHVCSAPLGYLVRRHTQIVRARQGG